MSKKIQPRLRTVNKAEAPYPLNKFPSDFGYKLGREIVYLLATKGKAVLMGEEWESIFASCIGAEWKPSNVGLDDVVLKNSAWGAKTVKANNPSRQSTVRLISGRNSPVYSFGISEITKCPPEPLGEQVLEIWNARVSGVRAHYENLRTIVLVKSSDLLEVAVFEFETIRYDHELYNFKWNDNGNLEGYDNIDGFHKFTWQPHGSQFTIIEPVPDDCLIIRIAKPEILDKDKFLNNIGFDKSWISVSKKNGR